jgi:glutamate-ammonia-ligase adenylyltransferase
MLLRRALDIIQAIVGRPVYISLLLEYPGAQTQMLTLCASSQWFADEIARYPILLDELLNSEDLFRQNDREQLAIELEHLMSHIDADDLEQQMDSLRQFRRTAAFKLAATDMIDTHAIEDVGSKLSAIAEAVLGMVFQLGWDAISARHGVPMCTIDGVEYRPGMAIIGYGKLGGRELGYGSDLDIIFLHDSAGERQHTDGERSIDNSQFFARVAQKMLHILGTRMHSGLLYEADTRLRPDGNAGLLVSGLSAFEDYLRNKAWTWEHQALLRARAISGSEPVRREFDRIRQSVLVLAREPGKVLADVAEMREKMRAHLGSKPGGVVNIKQDEGGMVDIEFVTQAGLLLNAHDRPGLVGPTSTLRFLPLLVDAGWFAADEAEDLAVAYRAFRQLANRQALQVELPENINSLMQPHRDRVSEIWNRLIVAGVSQQ